MYLFCLGLALDVLIPCYVTIDTSFLNNYWGLTFICLKELKITAFHERPPNFDSKKLSLTVITAPSHFPFYFCLFVLGKNIGELHIGICI